MAQKSLRKLPSTPRQYQKSAIDALEMEMKLELKRLQKYNETGDDQKSIIGWYDTIWW